MGFFDALKGELNENETEQERFTVKYEQYLGAYANHITVVVDNQTGVNYAIIEGDSPKLTPLLDEDGKVLVDDIT